MVRVLALTSPGIGHVFPLVPTLWAARNAGAAVLIGTAGAGVGVAAGAGLPVVDLDPGDTAGLASRRLEFKVRMASAPMEDRLSLAMELFAGLADMVADRAIEIGKLWRPDVIVYTSLQPAGLLAARVLEIPAIEHGFQLSGVMRPIELMDPFVNSMRARHGLADLGSPDVAIDVCPGSLLLGEARGRAMGFRPYSGGHTVDTAVLAPPSKQRVVLTLGTSVGNSSSVLSELADVIGESDVEMLVAGDLPASTSPVGVLAHGWLPLDTVLPGCAALVHHGGAGTLLTGLAHGVPQVVVPIQADHALNATAITRRGVGVESQSTDPVDVRAALNTVLDGTTVHAAKEIAAEMAATPGPIEVIPSVLEELLGTTDSSK